MTDKTVEPDNYTPEEREAMGWPKPQTVEQEIDGILGGFMLDWVEAVEKAKGDKKAETRYMREAVKIRTEQLLTLLTANASDSVICDCVRGKDHPHDWYGVPV